MDLEIDQHEKSRETGRDRPLVFGWATEADYRKISLIIMIVVFILVAYLATQRIFILLLFFIGIFFDYGYNHPRIALAYRPFTEWYIFPWLVVGVTVTVVYAATGIFSPLAFVLSLLHGLTVTCFVVSMMRRDERSDRAGGKMTSSVEFPRFPHSTVYGLVTVLTAALCFFPLTWILGTSVLAYDLVLVTIITGVVITILGARIDQLSTRVIYSDFPDFELKAHKLVIRQIRVSLINAIAVAAILIASGGIVCALP